MSSIDDDGTPPEAGAASATGHRPRRRRRRILIALGVVGALVLAGCAVVGGYLYTLQDSFYSKSTQVALPESTHADGEGENYLLLGSDKRDPDSAEAQTVKGQRSDVMMLVHVNADRTQAYVISFPRDLYVDIPGHGRNRINSALAFGGIPLAVTTVEDYTGARIDDAALIDFDGVEGLVDALGGVDVQVDQSFEGDGVQFTQGTQHMDGATALTFVRQRKQLEDGDFARNRHQQALLAAIAAKIISADTLSNPIAIRELVDTTAPFMTVDEGLTPSAIASTAYDLRSLRSSDIRYLSVPHAGPMTTDGGASVVGTDEAGMDELRTALQEDDMEGYYSSHSG
ncbi:LCP family protein [Brachybacterium nesterenkovii]|uniref:COG1316: Transcriptional regulator n=1 Tax=Brachybacterium nesterenkovii TaxID=47847 RepID=A0A1X6WT41_9MICO|nr:LCP family protein [Brachybacterium nesterenkovii]SLM88067.1 COG1316: Transcriptional regulator [Brachybacterium nesterenkovii]